MTATRFIDAFDCSQRGLRYEGDVPLARLARLAEDLPAQSGVASWSVQGATGRLSEPLLRLEVRAEPLVTCQRCLAPFAWPVDTEVELQLVASEAELDAPDAQADEGVTQAYDKVLGSARFDVLAQVEDELILSLPYIPRHPVCPGESPAGADVPEPPGEAERRRPFAALGELKGRLRKG